MSTKFLLTFIIIDQDKEEKGLQFGCKIYQNIQHFLKLRILVSRESSSNVFVLCLYKPVHNLTSPMFVQASK